MASHAGLKYVLETKKGYVKENGNFTNQIDEALLIDFLQFGWGPDAKKVYQKLGFQDQEVIESGVSFHQVIPAYEGRDLMGIYDYQLMGYDYKKAFYQSREDYFRYRLYDDENCIEYKKNLKSQVLDYYKKCKNVSQILKTDQKELALYETNEKDEVVLNGTLKHYYSEIGEIYRYSIPLKNPHVEKYFDLVGEELEEYNHFQQEGLIAYFLKRFHDEKFSFGLHFDTKILEIKMINNELIMYLNDWHNWNNDEVAKGINKIIRDFY